MGTDIFTILRFFREGRDFFAYLNIAFVGVTLLLHLLLVIAQNKKRGAKVIAYEMLIVASMLKPAVDAKRVVKGDAEEVGTLVMSRLTEDTIAKSAAMFGESIPSCVLQMYALLDAGEIAFVPIFSILVSAGAISFTSTSFSLSWDTDPERRIVAPQFYGFAKDTGRLQLMIFMMSMTIFHVLMKMLASALLLRLNKLWLLMYIVIDMGLLLLYKIVRGELRYWVNIPGILGWVVSISMRIIAKTISDFTLLMHFRHPLELGGGYWVFNMVVNQISCFLSVLLYKRFSKGVGSGEIDDASTNSTSVDDSAIDDGIGDVDTNSTSIAANVTADAFLNETLDTSLINCMDTITGCLDMTNTTESGEANSIEPHLWTLVIGLFVLSMLMFYAFLISINKEYIKTFFDIQSGKQYVRRNFDTSKTDSEKFVVFAYHRSYYKSFEGKLKDWLIANWANWEEEKPDWFTAAAISRVPIDMLPPKLVADLGGVEGARRSIRNSVVKEKKEEREEKEKLNKSRRTTENQILPFEGFGEQD